MRMKELPNSRVAAALCLLCARMKTLGAEEVRNPDTAGLPPRSVGEHVTPRPVPEWVRTHLRVGHLPGSLPMAAEFLKAGYNVVTLHVLSHWDEVGPSAHLYPAERVTYQKLAALPEELDKQWGFPNQSELRGTWPVREEIIPLAGVRVLCRVPGVKQATLQPGAVDLPLSRTADGVLVTVPRVEMHCLVVFE